ncbi:MAG: hypothetical protein ABEJ61_10360 [Haloferacaceae archaeon]
MTETVRVAVPRKGRPLEAVLEHLAERTGAAAVADDVISTLQYEKAVTKGSVDAPPDRDVYERLADYSDLEDPLAPEFTLLRDDRAGAPRRIVLDSLTLRAPEADVDLQLVGREEPFRALRTHSFALGFDSADLVLEEVVELREEGVAEIAAINERIDPMETDVRVVDGLGDTVHHTLLATPETLGPGGTLDRSFVEAHEGPLCISPRYERLVEAVLGTRALSDVSFVYPPTGVEEEAAVADAGLGVYLTVTGSTAREHGLVVGERLFPSETVLMENDAEIDGAAERARRLLGGADRETAIRA